jgi:hypothetical protein
MFMVLRIKFKKIRGGVMYLEDDEARGKADTCNDCGNEGKWCSCGEDPDRSYKEGLEDE